MDVCYVYSCLLWQEVFKNTTENKKKWQVLCILSFVFLTSNEILETVTYQIIREVVFSLLPAPNWHFCTRTRRRRTGQTTLEHEATPACDTTQLAATILQIELLLMQRRHVLWKSFFFFFFGFTLKCKTVTW